MRETFPLPLAAVLLLLALPGALADVGPGPQVGLAGSYDTHDYAWGEPAGGTGAQGAAR